MGSCWMCGRNGWDDPLDTHHIFGGANRAKSEKYGLTVRLCHRRCHIFGSDAVHRNPEAMRRLREYGQREAMARFGWSIDDFRREFGKNYIAVAEDTSSGVVAPPSPQGEGFGIDTADAVLCNDNGVEAESDFQVLDWELCVNW